MLRTKSKSPTTVVCITLNKKFLISFDVMATGGNHKRKNKSRRQQQKNKYLLPIYKNEIFVLHARLNHSRERDEILQWREDL